MRGSQSGRKGRQGEGAPIKENNVRILRCVIIWSASRKVSSHMWLRICVCLGGRTGDELETMSNGETSWGV